LISIDDDAFLLLIIELTNDLDVVRVDLLELGCAGVARQLIRNSEIIGS
jgi:hypothetical protein